MARSFREYLDAFGDDQVRRVAIEYAEGKPDVTIASLMESHHLTKYAVEQLLAYAVTNLLVSYQSVEMMKTKAHANQLRHFSEKEEPTPSDYKYNKLKEKRLNFIRFNLSDERIEKIVNNYINFPRLSAERVARKLGLSVEELNLCLKKAIVTGLIDDDSCNRIISISIDKSPNKKMTYYTLMRLKKRRYEYTNLLNNLCEVTFSLENYDYFESEKTRDELQEEITLLEEELFEFLKQL